MVHHVAKVLSVAGKEAILRLIDGQNYSLSGIVVNYYHKLEDAQKEIERLKKESGPIEPGENPVSFVIVSY